MSDYGLSFEKFWDAWPKSKDKKYFNYKRKVNKPACWKKWKDRGLDESAEMIIKNVETRAKYDRAWLDDNGKYLCAPLVYINNNKWEDDINDLRDAAQRHEEDDGSPTVDGLTIDYVRQAVIHCIKEGDTDEIILENFNVSSIGVNNLRREIEAVVG